MAYSGHMIVTVGNAKGGVGKTTLAVALAEAGAKQWGSALVVDTDGAQLSAMRWHELAGPGAMRAVPLALPTTDLARGLTATTAASSPLVVIDTGPGRLDVLRAALEVADAAAVPLRPAVADVDRAWLTLDFARQADTPALAVLTMGRPRTVALGAAQAALREAHVAVASTLLPSREAIGRNFGEPVTEPLASLAGSLLDELARTVRRTHGRQATA